MASVLASAQSPCLPRRGRAAGAPAAQGMSGASASLARKRKTTVDRDLDDGAPLERVTEEALESVVQKVIRTRDAEIIASRDALLSDIESRFAAALERDLVLAGERPPQYVKCAGGETHIGATFTHARCGWEFVHSGQTKLCQPTEASELCKACLRSRP